MLRDIELAVKDSEADGYGSLKLTYKIMFYRVLTMGRTTICNDPIFQYRLLCKRHQNIYSGFYLR